MNTQIPDDQESDFPISESKSVFSGRINVPKKKKQSHLFLWGMGICLVLLFAYAFKSEPTFKSGEITTVRYQTNIKMDQLSTRIVDLDQKQLGINQQIADLKNSLVTHLQQERRIRGQAQSIAFNKNNIASYAKGQCGQVSESTIPDPYKPDKRPSDQTKPSYLTPELEAISEFRAQSCKNTPIGTGDKIQLKFLITNKGGQTIDQVLYNEDLRNKRTQFYKKRINYMEGKNNFESLPLIKYNFKIDKTLEEEQKRVETQEYERIHRVHHLSQITAEIPMCVVVPSYNNNAKFRIEYNLNSIFNQNYTNYFVVIINDVSTDGSDQVYRKYLNFYNISKHLYAYRQNFIRRTALENIYIATHYYCSHDSVVLNLDGDDEFVGKNVLKIFNAGYQRLQSGVIYSNFYWYDQQRTLNVGFTSEYTDSQKKGTTYRQSAQRFSHLRTYKTELFRKIEAKDLQDSEGKFFRITYDFAMYFPLMELACQRVNKIEGYHYLYNINTGLNDYAVDGAKQVAVDRQVRGGRKYSCDKDFQEKIKK